MEAQIKLGRIFGVQGSHRNLTAAALGRQTEVAETLTGDEMILRVEIDRGRGFLFSDTLWQLKRSPRMWQWPFRTFRGREH
jgi:hypothetical protein